MNHLKRQQHRYRLTGDDFDRVKETKARNTALICGFVYPITLLGIASLILFFVRSI